MKVEITNGCVKNEGFPRFGKVILYVENGKVEKSILPDFLDENTSIYADSSVEGSESVLVQMSGGSDVAVRVNLIDGERGSFEDENGKHFLPDISLRGVVDEIRVREGYSTKIYFKENGKSIDVSVINEEEYKEDALGIQPPPY